MTVKFVFLDINVRSRQSGYCWENLIKIKGLFVNYVQKLILYKFYKIF